ncbi:MAG: NAD(P)/FAD-dependent oxidoreductase [Bacteroidales bacterium]|nr:NAD(P)/FAD-dependent oxidoreductase [Bacteroidales bacterium]
MSFSKPYDVIVIGAGPAGLLAAGRAAELGSRVLLIERMRSAGRKLLITGKGRCNITNMAPQSEFLKKVHPNGKFLKSAFSQFFSGDIIELLKNNGLETIVERGDRVFPETNKASDVLNALIKWISGYSVDFMYDTRVSDLIIKEGKVSGVKIENENTISEIYARSVIICTGGKSYPATGSTGDGYKLAESAGHHIEVLRQALVPLETEGSTAGKMQGLSLKNVKAILWIEGKKQAEDFGELLFTHFGLSGPIILTLSRIAVDALRTGKRVELSIDLKPALDEQKLDTRLIRDLNENGKKHLENAFRLWLPSSIIPVFFEILSLDPKKECHQVSSKERKKIMLLMKDFRFKITGCRSFKEAVVTAGGVSTSEVDSKTMESKLVKNLYFAGEVLDLDADTGGFNLQVAWSTGWVAGTAASQK